VGSFFCDFFCPAILGPKLFDLCEEHPPANIARDLTLIAKTLQNLSNLVGFGKKEPYMKDVNPYIEERIPQMKEFIQKVCSIPIDPIDEVPSAMNALGFGREMARVHGHLVAGLKDIKEKFGAETPAVIKLARLLNTLNEDLREQENGDPSLPTPGRGGPLQTPSESPPVVATIATENTTPVQPPVEDISIIVDTVPVVDDSTVQPTPIPVVATEQPPDPSVGATQNSGLGGWTAGQYQGVSGLTGANAKENDIPPTQDVGSPERAEKLRMAMDQVFSQ